MARCECGALYVPSGKNVKITFKQGGLSTHTYLEHTTDVLVLDEEKLVSYGNVPASPSITPSLISISFDNAENLKTTGMMKLIVRKGSVKLVEKYLGTKDHDWVLPLVDDLPTITASCSDILNDIDVSDSKIYVEIISVCDLSPGDCCGNTVDILFRNIVHSICTEEEVVVQPTGTIWRYTPDGNNCRQDVDGIYASYPDCYASIQQEIDVNATTTTCDPNDEDCVPPVPPVTTTEGPPPSEWTLMDSIEHPFTDSFSSLDFSLHKNGTQIVIANRSPINSALPDVLAVYKKDSDGCGWTQRGSEISGGPLLDHLSTDFSGGVFVSMSGEACARFEWDENEEDWSQVSTLNFQFPSGDGVSSTDITPDGRYVAIAEYNYDGPDQNYGSEFAGNECGVIEIHEWDGSTWSQVGQTLFGDRNTNMGMSLNLTPDGQTIYFGTRTSRSPQTSKVYTYDGSSWSQQGNTIYPLLIPNVAQKMGNDLGITASGMLVSGNDANSSQGLIETLVWDGTDWSRVTQESGEEYLSAPTQAGTTTITSDGRHLFRMRLDNSTNEQNDNQFEFSRYENMGSGVWGNPLSLAASSPHVMSYRTAPNWSSDDGHYAAILLIDGLTNEKRVDIYSDLASCTTSTPAPTTPAPTTPAPTTSPPQTTTTTTTTLAP